MLGAFIRAYKAGNISELQSIEILRSLPPGTPVVILQDPASIQSGGIGSQIAFAIVSATPGSLIMQRVESDSETGTVFHICEVIAEPTFHYFTCPSGTLTPEATLQRAQAQLGARYSNALRSFPGDDFVQECLTGLSIHDIIAQEADEIGQHWWTPLEVTPKQILDDLSEVITQKLADIPEKETAWQATARKLAYKKLERTLNAIKNTAPEKLLNITLPQLEHHAILIEGAQCILFSGAGVRHMSKQDFCNTTPNTPIGGPAKGTPQDKHDVELRLLARNRAVRQLCRAGQGKGEWDDFNLILNNSEHFSRYCRSGEASCTQLRDKTITAVKTILSIILPGWLTLMLDVILAQLDLTPGKHASMN